MTTPLLGAVTVRQTSLGQTVCRVMVHYPYERPYYATFLRNTSGGPVVMVTPAFPRGEFVTDPERFGEFGKRWVHRFFA